MMMMIVWMMMMIYDGNDCVFSLSLPRDKQCAQQTHGHMENKANIIDEDVDDDDEAADYDGADCNDEDADGEDNDDDDDDRLKNLVNRLLDLLEKKF